MMEKMKNDIKGANTPFGSTEMEQVPRLAEFRVERYETYKWALKDCKFLVFDDTNLINNGYDSDDEDGMLQFAMGISNQNSDEPKDRKGKGKARESQQGEGQTPHQDEKECEICSSCPEFPHKWRPTKFRLFRPRDSLPHIRYDMKDNCYHFLAISYCWPQLIKDANGKIIEEKRNYQVRDLDGTVRANRALDDVIDRAVDAAISFGLRMIWIDQECLPQPKDTSPKEDKDERQIGIQAMDILYSRAMVTAGLHSVELSSQSQIDAIRFALDPQRYGRGRAYDFDQLLRFFEQVCEDLWYTRAWVVQESLSAGDRLFLVFRRANGISFPSEFQLGGTKPFGLPRNSLLSEDRGLQSRILCVSVMDFRRLIEEAKQLVQYNSFMALQGPQLDLASMDEHSSIFQRSASIVNKAEKLHPILLPGNHLSIKWTVLYPCGISKRSRVEAAGALTLLKSRECRDVKDLIAIMANMCGYEIRLDTNKAEKHCKSLRVGFLTLAILNGDFSLLVPEVYAPWGDMRISSQAGLIRSSPAWLSPFDTNPGASDYVMVHSLHGVRQKNFTRSSAVFDFPAYNWIVENKIDLTPVKFKWEEDWERMKCVGLASEVPENERDKAYEARRERIVAEMGRITTSKFRQGRSLVEEMNSLNNIDMTGFRIIPVLMPERVEQSSEMQTCIGRIFFDILRCLMNQKDTEPTAIGVANSIWQSMRVDEVRDESPPLPDVVTEALFDHPDVISRPFESLKLDRGPDRQYLQVWLFDRVMADGYIWAGRYQRSTNPITMMPDIETDEDTEISDCDENQIVPHSEDSDVQENGEPSSMGARRSRSHSNPRSKPTVKTKSILEKQMGRQMLGIFALEAMISATLEGKRSGGYPDINPGSITAFSFRLADSKSEFSQEKSHVESLASAFDVDGPCIVSTPYNSAWEMLPHPKLRSMSICWVVERVQRSNDPELCSTSQSSGKESQQLKRQMSQVVTRQGEPPEPDYQPCEMTVRSLEQGIVAEPVRDEKLLKYLSDRYDKARPTYRVLKKVRGMWEIMELPNQLYTFI